MTTSRMSGGSSFFGAAPSAAKDGGNAKQQASPVAKILANGFRFMPIAYPIGENNARGICPMHLSGRTFFKIFF